MPPIYLGPPVQGSFNPTATAYPVGSYFYLPNGDRARVTGEYNGRPRFVTDYGEGYIDVDGRAVMGTAEYLLSGIGQGRLRPAGNISSFLGSGGGGLGGSALLPPPPGLGGRSVLLSGFDNDRAGRGPRQGGGGGQHPRGTGGGEIAPNPNVNVNPITPPLGGATPPPVTGAVRQAPGGRAGGTRPGRTSWTFGG